MPFAAVASLAVHALLFLVFLWTAQKAADGTKQIVSNVDLIIPVKKSALPVPVEQKAKQTTLDFLKLALPAIPKVVGPKLAAPPSPTAARPLAPVPEKIQDRGRRVEAPKLEGMDLGRRSADLAKLNAAPAATRRISAMEATAPKLEEVGRRKSKLADIAPLEEAGAARAGAQLASIKSPIADTGRRPAGAAAMAPSLQEAERSAGMAGTRSKLADLLPEAAPARAPMRVVPSALSSPMKETKAPPRKAEAQFFQKNKGVELEGPISGRSVASYEIPKFPAWLGQLGVVDAQVRIKFWVAPDGSVLPDMRVELTSGYGRLDREAMAALRSWKFAPIFNNEKQWGVITFTYQRD